MANKILVLGKGYLGKEFERHGFETWGKRKFKVDYLNEKVSGHKLSDLKEYDVIVNCIGKSNTRWCEKKKNFKEALYVNGELPNVLSMFCNQNNMKFVQISTGCLYDDTTKPNKEDSFLSAHCNYTITKWVGEIGCNPKTDLIIRPRLFFSDIDSKNNLLSKLSKFKSYTGDMQDSVTCTSTIVGAVKELLTANQSGIFNVAQAGSGTIADIAGWCGIKVKQTNTANELREQQGLYLVNNVMDITKLQKFYTPMGIEDSVKLSYAELKPNDIG
jgi:dTDP-4-dehydrorhamnose reductase